MVARKINFKKGKRGNTVRICRNYAVLNKQLEDIYSLILVIISTCEGLFAMNTLPFWVKFASFYYKKYIEQIFQHIENVVTFNSGI